MVDRRLADDLTHALLQKTTWDGVGATLGARDFWLLWKSSLLWAIPVTYVVCVFGTVSAFVIVMIRGGYPDALDDYVHVVGAGIPWGIIFFIGTCLITIPMFSLAS